MLSYFLTLIIVSLQLSVMYFIVHLAVVSARPFVLGLRTARLSIISFALPLQTPSGDEGWCGYFWIVSLIFYSSESLFLPKLEVNSLNSYLVCNYQITFVGDCLDDSLRSFLWV